MPTRSKGKRPMRLTLRAMPTQFESFDKMTDKTTTSKSKSSSEPCKAGYSLVSAEKSGGTPGYLTYAFWRENSNRVAARRALAPPARTALNPNETLVRGYGRVGMCFGRFLCRSYYLGIRIDAVSL